MKKKLQDNLPVALKKLKNFTLWGSPHQKDGVPINANTGYPAKFKDENERVTLAEALELMERHKCDGVGFVFTQDTPYVGVDLDDVLEDIEEKDKEGKVKMAKGIKKAIEPEVLSVLNALDSYTEISPSGNGLHVILEKKGVTIARNRRFELNGVAVGFEVYSQNKVFRMTGQVFQKRKFLFEASLGFDWFCNRYFKKKKDAPALPAVAKPSFSCEELTISKIIEILEKSHPQKADELKALYFGGWKELGKWGEDHSSADLALCAILAYWFKRDSPKIDAVFRESALFREKWDKSRGGSGGTYGSNTIYRAVSTCNAVYTDFHSKTRVENIEPLSTLKTQNRPTQEKEKILFSDSDFINNGFYDEMERLKSVKALSSGFPHLDHYFKLLPSFCVLGAPSSLGKTTFALNLACNLAKQGKPVLFVSLEQTKFELITKTLSRLIFNSGITAQALRLGQFEEERKEALKRYSSYSPNIFTMEEYNPVAIENAILELKELFGTSPAVFIDYLQIIPTTQQTSAKDKADLIVKNLKALQRRHDLFLMVISSINRASYLQALSFESFKESGGIEYTADVLFGLQTYGIEQQTGNSEERRAFLAEERQRATRRLELVCLKNRSGLSHWRRLFKYVPAQDFFKDVLDFGDDNLI